MTEPGARRLHVASRGEGELDRLFDIASRRRIESHADADALIREALIVGQARTRSRRTRRTATWTGCAALVSACAALWLIHLNPSGGTHTAPPPAVPATARSVGTDDANPSSGISSLILPGAHRARAAAGSDLTVVTANETETLLQLREGTALFEVTPLRNMGRFEVRTPDAVAIVRGTIFAVTVRERHTRVDVFEGRVEVQDGAGSHMVSADEAYGAVPRSDVPLAIEESGRQAARSRAWVAPATKNVGRTPIARRAVTLQGLRTLCDRGAFQEALDAIESASPEPGERGEWAMVEGDAHRALGRPIEAARAYERAASDLAPSRAALTGFFAATQYERVSQPSEALVVLDRTHAWERGAPLEESALAMRASLLARLGRSEEAETAARRYVYSFPGGPATSRMEAILTR